MLHNSQVHLNRLFHDDAGLGGTFDQNLFDQGHAHEGGDDLLRPCGRGQNIDITHGFIASAVAARSSYMFQAIHPSQMGKDFVHNGLSHAEENASAALPVSLDGLLDVLLFGWPHPGKPADAVLLCGLFEHRPD